MQPEEPPLLYVTSLRKTFPGTTALNSVDVAVSRGEIRAIVGENGAGKSTLIKILAGIYPYGSWTGEMWVRGQAARFHSPKDAESWGIALVPQELQIVGGLSVGENIFLNRLPRTGWRTVDWNRVYLESHSRLLALGLDVDTRLPARSLSVAEQRAVMIARALGRLSGGEEILILDEPTASLPRHEATRLLDQLRGLRRRQSTVIYISHKLDEVLSLADHITVMRDGAVVAELPARDATESELARLMVGRSVHAMFPALQPRADEIALQVNDVALATATRSCVRGVSFEVRRGEIVGIYGLVGSGASELLLGLFGAWTGHRQGSMRLRGRKVSARSTAVARRAGIGLVPADRKRRGLILGMSVAANISLASMGRVSRAMIIDREAEEAMARKLGTRLRIRAPGWHMRVGALSGGNQQKTVVARWLAANVDVLLLDEPTQGIDVGAKAELYELFAELAAEGMAIVIASSEPREALGTSHRILIMRDGIILKEVDPQRTSEHALMALATAGG